MEDRNDDDESSDEEVTPLAKSKIKKLCLEAPKYMTGLDRLVEDGANFSAWSTMIGKKINAAVEVEDYLTWAGSNHDKGREKVAAAFIDAAVVPHLQESIEK